MKRRTAALARLLCPALVALACLAPSAPSAEPVVPATQGEDAAAAMKGETRLRKLHLVRPDLIPYPIAFEIYC